MPLEEAQWARDLLIDEQGHDAAGIDARGEVEGCAGGDVLDGIGEQRTAAGLGAGNGLRGEGRDGVADVDEGRDGVVAMSRGVETTLVRPELPGR